MADSQISRVLIPCFVVQLNNQQLISEDGSIGKVENVPCRDSLVDEVLYWCSPVKDEGIFDALQFRLAIYPNEDKPTYDSFLVQRIRDKLTNYTWWVYVLTANDFKNSCNSCCGEAAIPMPGVNGDFNPVFAPCQTLCAEDNSGNIEGVFGIPTLGDGQQYYPYGSYDNTPFPTPPNSFSSIASMLVYMNANWNTISSPSASFVWTSPDSLTLIATGGIAGHELCVTVLSIDPSP